MDEYETFLMPYIYCCFMKAL